jgi:glycosyltransferase involved in cell wall biosynthesis
MRATSVSVVIAAYDSSRFVAEAMQSVLEQTRPPDALLLVDDGSTDGTADIAESMGATVLRRHHEGIGPTRNAGIAATDTELVAFLDADDVWLPAKLERQLAAIESDPGLGAVFCLVDEFLDGIGPRESGTRLPLTGCPGVVSSGALLRRSVIDRIGPFAAGVAGDWLGWWTRARGLDVREYVVPEVLFRRRIHGRNHSLAYDDSASAFIDIARRNLQRRRSENALRVQDSE